MASRSISSRAFFYSRYIHDLSDIGSLSLIGCARYKPICQFCRLGWFCCFDLLPVGFSSKKEEHRPGSHTSDIHGLDREILLLLCSSKQNIALSNLSGSCRTTFGQFWPKEVAFRYSLWSFHGLCVNWPFLRAFSVLRIVSGKIFFSVTFWASLRGLPGVFFAFAMKYTSFLKSLYISLLCKKSTPLLKCLILTRVPTRTGYLRSGIASIHHGMCPITLSPC